MATATGATGPKLNHIGLPVIGVSRRQIDAVRRLRPQRNLRAHHRRHVRDGRRAGAGDEDERHRLLVEEPRLLHESLVLASTACTGACRSVTTGAMLANSTMTALGVSGDGDTASIGMGQFVHLMRRNLPMIYIIEDNGVYGLTKGQFSATADIGSKLKTGVINDLPPIDTCALAIQLGATFVGRSFSGDKKQLLAMLKAAIAHKGTVMLDVISPCVTFNDHEGSTKSYKFLQENDEPINEIGFVASFDDIEVDYDSGEVLRRGNARRIAIAPAQAA